MSTQASTPRKATYCQGWNTCGRVFAKRMLNGCCTVVRELSAVKASLIFKLGRLKLSYPRVTPVTQETNSQRRSRRLQHAPCPDARAQKPPGARACHKSRSRCQGHLELASVTGRSWGDGQNKTKNLHNDSSSPHPNCELISHPAPSATCLGRQIRTVSINPIWILIRAKRMTWRMQTEGWGWKEERRRRRLWEGGEEVTGERRDGDKLLWTLMDASDAPLVMHSDNTQHYRHTWGLIAADSKRGPSPST